MDNAMATGECPLVSIIIDNYNYDRFLEAAIDSALAQTYSKCEVIVVDDGSTDSSRQILLKYKTQIVIILQENQGQAAAFNAGFAASSGKLILFLDSDDLLHPDAIAELLMRWDESFSKIQFPLEVIDVAGDQTGLSMPSNRISQGDVIPSLLSVGRYVTSPTSGNLYARWFLNQVMPMPVSGWTQGNDSYLNTRAGFAGPIGAVHRRLGFYRVHGESMSTVVFKDLINLSQIEKLIQHGRRQQVLVNSLADSLHLPVNRIGLEQHWLQLKLTLTHRKLARPDQVLETTPLPLICLRFIRSAITDTEVSLLRKVQLSSWALAATLLPASLAQGVLTYGFDFAPRSTIKKWLRLSWNGKALGNLQPRRRGV